MIRHQAIEMAGTAAQGGKRMKTFSFTFKCEYFGARVDFPFFVDADTYHDATILADAYVKEKFPIEREQDLATIKFEGLGIDPKDWGKSRRELQGPCEYCQGDEQIRSDDNSVRLFIRDSTLVKFYDDGYGWQDEHFNFKYCPMCGRKLEVIG